MSLQEGLADGIQLCAHGTGQQVRARRKDDSDGRHVLGIHEQRLDLPSQTVIGTYDVLMLSQQIAGLRSAESLPGNRALTDDLGQSDSQAIRSHAPVNMRP